jgi:hypothetical protein
MQREAHLIWNLMPPFGLGDATPLMFYKRDLVCPREEASDARSHSPIRMTEEQKNGRRGGPEVGEVPPRDANFSI